MVAPRSTAGRLLWREQVADQFPLSVGEGCDPLFENSARRSPHEAPRRGRRSSSLEGSLRSVAALGHSLVRPAPQRPPQPELPLRLRSRHRQDKSTHLWHRERDQIRAGLPFLPLLSSLFSSLVVALERKTAR